jgi:hypothetical protein
MSKLLVAALVVVLPLLTAGCGEKSQVTVYKQGKYQGKPDNLPWDNNQFKNDKGSWEKSIRARNEAQNEYLRVGR